MRIKAIAASVAAVATLALGATGASAATEFGSNCGGDELSIGDVTLMTVSGPSGGLSAAAPSAGVITQLKVTTSEPLPIQFPFTAKVLRPAGGTQYTNVGQDTVMAGAGTSTKDTRISVQAGDKLGLHGQPFTFEGSPVPAFYLYCSGVVGGVLGYAEGDVAVGSTAGFAEAPAASVPISARVEPDADGDGYGDETQDKCPQSAAVQAECPVVVLDAYPVPGKNKVVVLVSVNNEASVTVSGSVKLPKAATSASASAAAKLKKVTRKVTPGKLGRFTLKFPGSLKQALADLPKGKKLKLKITASAKNVAGQVSKDKTTLKLKGES
jgi:hypothetical protein